jgi:ferric-dicitrate binding protein FerR (iron transport regulator)
MCCLLLFVFPLRMVAGELASAMLYTTGSAWVNGSAVPKSAAVFSGDLLQTRSDSTASIQANGSSVMVMADSLVKFEGPAVELEHGGVRVATSRSLEARAGDVIVKPAGNAWTEFQVVDRDGQVQIAANKGDVTVQDDKGTTTVTQGQQTTRDDTSDDEKKKKKRRRAGAATAAKGGVMSSPWAVYGGTAVIGGVALWIWLGHGGEGPVSPSCPSNPCQ